MPLRTGRRGMVLACMQENNNVPVMATFGDVARSEREDRYRA